MAGSGAIKGEGLIPADEDGLTRLAIEWGPEARGCVEMMSGAIWVKDQLELAGSEVEIAHARKARDIAPLACKTDKVDARVLAELCRRELVPAIWVGSPEDRAIRERLRRRMHLVKLRTSARNRIFGRLTQFGLRISFTRLRQPDAIEPLKRRRVPAVWRDSIAGHLDQISSSTGGSRRSLAMLASEIGEVSRFQRRSKLVGYAGLAPRINQSGERSQTGRLSKAGSRTLRWAAVEAANQAWRESNPFHGHYLRLAERHGRNPAKSAVARKLLICSWPMLSRGQVFQPARSTTATASSSRSLAA